MSRPTIEDAEFAIQNAVISSKSATRSALVAHPAISQAISQATSAGVSLDAILQLLEQFASTLLSGGSISIASIVADILALIPLVAAKKAAAF